MLKKTITYEDFNGNTVSEEFFFHLSKAELVEIEMSHEGGLSASLARIVAAEDAKSIIAEFKNILLSAYGKRSEDGRRFIKNQELRDEFESTEAYSALFMELVTDTTAAIEFINGIIPAGLAEDVALIAKSEEGSDTTVDNVVSDLREKLDNKPEPETITRTELNVMPHEEFVVMSERIRKGEVIVAE